MVFVLRYFDRDLVGESGRTTLSPGEPRCHSFVKSPAEMFVVSVVYLRNRFNSSDAICFSAGHLYTPSTLSIVILILGRKG